MKFASVKNKIASINHRHYIFSGVIIVIAVISVVFYMTSYVRIWESICDLGTSIVFYAGRLFQFETTITPTVIELSDTVKSIDYIFPTTSNSYGAKVLCTLHLVFNRYNIDAFFTGVSAFFVILPSILTVIVFVILMIRFLLKSYSSNECIDVKKESKAYKLAVSFQTKVLFYIWKYIRSLYDFMLENKVYIKLFVFEFAVIYRVIPVCIEFIAYVLYFSFSLDFLSFFVQVYRTVLDMSLLLSLPLGVWIIGALVLFDWLSFRKAYDILDHNECKNCGFVKSLPLVVMNCGLMGADKTTMLADMSLTRSKIIRQDVLDLLLKNQIKFPNFDWAFFENVLRQKITSGIIYSRATAKMYVINVFNHIARLSTDSAYYEAYKTVVRRERTRHRVSGWFSFFNYDFKHNRVCYDNSLVHASLLKACENYAQEYVIYTMTSSLILSNIALREDFVILDKGAFPLYDYDFFRSKVGERKSRYSHIADFDTFRMLTKLNEKNEHRLALDFGVVSISEIGKELGNQIENATYKKDDKLANPKNDGFAKFVKMSRQRTMLEYVTLYQMFCDEQRPESVMADFREVLQILRIGGNDKEHFALRGRALEDLFYYYIIAPLERFRLKYNTNRTDKTLIMYIVNNVVSAFMNHYERLRNKFTYKVKEIGMESGQLDGKIVNKKYYLSRLKIYRDRFATDCFSSIYEQESLNSMNGLAKVVTYKNTLAEVSELLLQNSYFANDMLNPNWREEKLRQLEEIEEGSGDVVNVSHKKTNRKSKTVLPR